jgi:hypothetical protein
MVKAWATGLALAAIFFFVAAPVVVPFVWPMSFYYELRSVTISDAMEGETPKVVVDRSIHRDFRGRYEIVIMRAVGGEYEPFWACGQHTSERRTYLVGAVLPENLDLDWWMDVPPNPPCLLPPGQYQVVTQVWARTPFNADVTTERRSNTFNIWPRVAE